MKEKRTAAAATIGGGTQCEQPELWPSPKQRATQFDFVRTN